jgi:tripartite-type tricarboxylate transporter receptor subunit TctC
MLNRREMLTYTGALGIPALTTSLVQAQSFEALRFVAGFPPGGTVDTVSRRVAEKLRTNGFAKSTVVDNRTGAGGQIAVQFMKTAPADGSTLLLTPMSMLGIYPHIYKKLQYEPLKDLSAVSVGVVIDFGFAVGPMVPTSVTNISEFWAWCKANPNLCNIGSAGAGSLPHFVGMLIGRSGGIELRHVAYRGTQAAILDMMGGQIAAVSGPIGEFTQHVATGKCRILSCSGARRSRFSPGTPTLTEQGLKDMVFNEWFGFFVPVATSQDNITKLNAGLRAALTSPEVVEGLAVMGLESAPSSPAELTAMLKYDHDRWAPIIKSIGFTAE